jgi:hypothetical protein
MNLLPKQEMEMELTREMLTEEPVTQVLARDTTPSGKLRRLVMFADLKTNAIWFEVNEARHDWLTDAIDAFNNL